MTGDVNVEQLLPKQYWIREVLMSLTGIGVKKENCYGPLFFRELKANIELYYKSWNEMGFYGSKIVIQEPWILFVDSERVYKKVAITDRNGFVNVQKLLDDMGIGEEYEVEERKQDLFKTCLLNWDTIQNLKDEISVVTSKGNYEEKLKVCGSIIDSFVSKFEIHALKGYKNVYESCYRTGLDEYLVEEPREQPSDRWNHCLKMLNFYSPLQVIWKNPDINDGRKGTYIILKVDNESTTSYQINVKYKFSLYVSCGEMVDKYTDECRIFDFEFTDTEIGWGIKEFRKLYLAIFSDESPIVEFYRIEEDERKRIKEEEERKKKSELERSLDSIGSLLDGIKRSDEEEEGVDDGPITFQPTGLVPVGETGVVPYEEKGKDEEEEDPYFDIEGETVEQKESGFNIFTMIKKAFE